MSILERAKDLISKLITFSFVFCALLVIVLAIGLEFFMPGQIFSLKILIPVIIISLAIALLTSIKTHHLKKEADGKRILRKRNKKKLFIYLTLWILISSAAIFIWWRIDTSINESLLSDAQKQFEIVNHGDVSKQRVDNTLIELERQIIRLRDKYEPTDTYETIKAEIYQSVSQLRRETSREKAFAFITFEHGKPIIHLPAEQSGNFFTGRHFTTNPGHELTHLVVYELLEPKQIKVVPLWFHEGVAVYESLKGFQNYRMRVCARFSLWQNRSIILDKKEVILEARDYPSENADIFYLTSFEFVDYLVSNYGQDTIPNILSMLKKETQFEKAFLNEVGYTIEEIYLKWEDSFF